MEPIKKYQTHTRCSRTPCGQGVNISLRETVGKSHAQHLADLMLSTALPHLFTPCPHSAGRWKCQADVFNDD